MSVLRLLSTPILKVLFITGVLGSLTLSTTLESLSILTENSFEIENIDWQEDSSEEKKEDKKENQKIHNFFKLPSSFSGFKSTQNQPFFLALFNRIYLEIPLQPPRLA